MICKEAIDLIKSFEGIHDGDLTVIGLQPKMCPAGIWTVGYGRALRSKETNKFLKGEEGRREALEKYPALTVKQAEEMLEHDLNIFGEQVRKLLTVNGAFIVSDNQFGALVSFAYNVGIGNFKSSTLLKKLLTGEYNSGADKEFCKWNKVGGKVMKGLTLRREAERKLFMS